jgi:T5SS/PEP-CTERM-associated repeat protein
LFCLSLAAGAACALAPHAHATDRFWGNTLGGSFTDPGNWSGGVVPVLGDAGIFDLGGLVYFVSVTNDHDLDRLIISSDTVSMTLNGAIVTCFYSVSEDDASLVVGNEPGTSGTLTISNGEIQSFYASVGENSGNGSLIFDGSGASWINANRIAIGNTSVGSLQIKNSADVLTGPAFFGKYDGSNGTGQVNGSGSTWDISAGLAVGSAGVGSLSILNGGYAEADLIYVGRFATGDGELIVSGSPSEFVSNGTLNVGVEGVGSLQVLNGAVLETVNLNVGTAATGDGEVVIDTLFGSVSASVAVNIGQTGNGSLMVTRGQISAPQINIGVGASGNGTGTVRFGAAMISSSVSVGLGGALDGDGSVTGSLSNGGVVEPGFPIGTLTVSGTYNQASGLGGDLVIDVEGLAKGTTHDWLSVGGAATIGGALTVDFAPGLTLGDGDVIEFLNASSVSGQFSFMQFNGLPSGLSADVEYTPTAARVVISGNRADLNGDGVVDGMDLAELLSFWGVCPAPCPPDFNNDGQVSGEDLALILASWTL